MEEQRFHVRSITYAIKAQNILERYHIPCRILRDRRIQRGCGYLILVRGDPAMILSLLSRHGIQAGKEPS